jgi:hypothetical protein
VKKLFYYKIVNMFFFSLYCTENNTFKSIKMDVLGAVKHNFFLQYILRVSVILSTIRSLNT